LEVAKDPYTARARILPQSAKKSEMLTNRLSAKLETLQKVAMHPKNIMKLSPLASTSMTGRARKVSD
jgi:hypothetical protein